MNKICIVLTMLLLPILAYAEGSGIWHDSYRGNFGENKGGLVLVLNGDDVLGELYFDSDYKDISLSGKIQNERGIELAGEDGLILKGRFLENDTKDGNALLKKEIMQGIITRNGVDSDFYVSIDHGSAGDLEHQYSIAGFDNDQELEAFAGKFKEAVLSEEREQVSKMLLYPITVELKDGIRNDLQSPDEFLSLYDEIFYSEFFKEFKEAIPHDMFAKYDGVMMSSDNNTFWVWFSCIESSDKKKIGVLSIFSNTNKLAKVTDKVIQ